MERAVGVVGRAEVAERNVRLAGQLLAQRPQQARLADPRLAHDQDHLAVAVFGPGPALQEDRELVLAPDQGCQALAAQRLEPPLGTALALDPEGRERLGEALETGRAEVGQLEQAADQAPGRLADDDAARVGERLEPGREVRGLADHRAFLRLAFAHQLADHHQPGRDPDPRRQRAAGGRKPGDRLNQREARPDRPLGVVLVRLWPAEIGEHAIAHELGDVALEAQRSRPRPHSGRRG